MLGQGDSVQEVERQVLGLLRALSGEHSAAVDLLLLFGQGGSVQEFNRQVDCQYCLLRCLRCYYFITIWMVTSIIRRARESTVFFTNLFTFRTYLMGRHRKRAACNLAA